jgi:hypothetical protein
MSGALDFSRWAASWSRRNTESVLGFFTDDALYLDETRNFTAYGKVALRKLLCSIFHASNAEMVIESAEFSPSSDQIELKWVQTGSRIYGQDLNVTLGSGTVHGESDLWLQGGKIVKCIDRPNPQDLNQIGLKDLNFDPKGPPGTIIETESEVVLGHIKLLKLIRFKTRPASPGEGTPND